MAKELKLRRGTTAEHSTFTGAEGEVTIDTTKDTAVVHDGVTAGGIPLAKEADIPTGALASLNEVNAATIADNSVGAAELNVPGNGTAGQYLASDGDGTMTWTTLPAGGGFSNMDVFTSPGTWTNPGNITKVKVTVTGGGGGGSAVGTGEPFLSIANGGAAGGTAIEVIPFPSGTNVAVTVGPGGARANPAPGYTSGSAGGTSSFGAYCSATGGGGGIQGGSPGSIASVGGTGSGGTLNIDGGDGHIGGGGPAGGGGSSYWGGGAPGRRKDGNVSAQPAGRAYGSGGGGGFPQISPLHLASAGRAGVVVVEF